MSTLLAIISCLSVCLFTGTIYFYRIRCESYPDTDAMQIYSGIWKEEFSDFQELQILICIYWKMQLNGIKNRTLSNSH